ncbi:hypothetical protein WJX73_005110 [Symbiochloris irregularis]|uniref:Probable magnesium transporter n=1 Tax=Symbiochloris irregularis TaxID=706552 RepID=A0AAW1P718_9CHLO
MTWIVGALINLIGSVLINFGTNVMKLGHNKRAAFSDAERPPIRKIYEWQLGVALFAVGNVLNFVSLGFAAQSLLAALGSVQFVSNVLFARFVLKEKVTNKVLAATACIVGGCSILVVFGNHTSDTLTVKDMIKYYDSAGYITYLALILLSSGAMFFIYRHGKRKLALEGREALSGRWMRVLPVSYALYAGMLGTQSVVFCKSLSTLLRTTFAGDSQLASLVFWGLTAAFLASATFWVNRLNQGLKEFPSIVIVPMMQISWTLFSIVSGGIYFKEYRTFTALSGFMFTVGVLVVCAGVYLLTPSKRAYLRYYKELENDILGRRRSLQTVDVEALVPEGPMAADRKFAAVLSKSMGSDADEAELLPTTSDAKLWSKAMPMHTLDLRTRHTSEAVEHSSGLIPAAPAYRAPLSPLPAAHVTVLAALPVPGLRGLAGSDDASSTSSRGSGSFSLRNHRAHRSMSSSNEGSLAPSPRALEVLQADRGSLPPISDWPTREAVAGHPQPRASRERDFATLFPPLSFHEAVARRTTQ